jgi:hypothetical protein
MVERPAAGSSDASVDWQPSLASVQSWQEHTSMEERPAAGSVQGPQRALSVQ